MDLNSLMIKTPTHEFIKVLSNVTFHHVLKLPEKTHVKTIKLWALIMFFLLLVLKKHNKKGFRFTVKAICDCKCKQKIIRKFWDMQDKGQCNGERVSDGAFNTNKEQ